LLPNNRDGIVALTLGIELVCYYSPMRTVSYSRHGFLAEVIQHAVWLYFRFPLSFRNRTLCTALRDLTFPSMMSV
jgi:hypothetical protein